MILEFPSAVSAEAERVPYVISLMSWQVTAWLMLGRTFRDLGAVIRELERRGYSASELKGFHDYWLRAEAS